MTFNQLVWKMTKVNYKRYTFYFLCNCFAVLFFFMFSTIYFNEKVIGFTENMKQALVIPGVALIVFTVFFISYAHNIFMKKRYKEFGLFKTLGMTSKDIIKLLLRENIVIGCLSILVGMLGGAVFSRLFFLLLMKSVGIEAVPFKLNGEMFLYTFLAFSLVFSIAVGKSLILLFIRSDIDSLKSDRAHERMRFKSPFLGVIGIGLMLAAITFIYRIIVTTDLGEEQLPLWMVVLLLGLYMSINQFMSFFLEFSKKNKRFYYRKLLSLTSLEYKFKQLTSIMMLVSVMVMVTVFYSSVVLHIYTSVLDQVKERNPYDIAYIQTETKNNIPKDTFYSILDKEEHRIEEHLEVPLMIYYEQDPNWDEAYYDYLFIPLTSYQKITSDRTALKENEYIYFINEKQTNDSEDVQGKDALHFTLNGGEEASYSLKKVMVEADLNHLTNLYNFIVVSDEEYERLQTGLPETMPLTIQLINTASWENTGKAVEKLANKFQTLNAAAPPIDHVVMNYTTEDTLFKIESKVQDYDTNKNESGIVFFVATFLSIIFFIGTLVLLYLSIFNDIEKEQLKYKKLYKIGITAKEVKKMIASELKVLFFSSTIIGIILALLFVGILASDIGGLLENPSLLMNYLAISFIYLTIQVIYYFLAKRKMFTQLVGT